MKKSLYSNKLWIISLFIIIVWLFMSSNISALWSIMWYGSNGDFSNPVNTFSGNVVVSSWSLSATLTQAVQVSNNGINIVIPNWTVIWTANWSSFDVNQIQTSLLATLPIALATSEQEVWKISFWINWQKLNFSKPVKISIPVSTTKSTVKIKVKHSGIDWYQTNSLTDTLTSSCNNGIASPSSNIAPVSSWIATIYTCSASQFVAVVDVVTSSSSSWWGGWWSRLYKDNCPDWDFSPSYYDRSCWTKPVQSSTWLDYNQVVDADKLPTKTGVKWELKIVNYKWVEIVAYEWYHLSPKAGALSMKIVDIPKLTLEEKTSYVNRVNEYLTAKHEYDSTEVKDRITKNKLNKQIVLLIWAADKLKKDIKR